MSLEPVMSVSKVPWDQEIASVRLGPKTLRTLDEEVKSLVSAWRVLPEVDHRGFARIREPTLRTRPTVSFLWSRLLGLTFNALWLRAREKESRE